MHNIDLYRVEHIGLVKTQVLCLQIASYGLKQASRVRYVCIDSYQVKHWEDVLIQTSTTKVVHGTTLILVLYIDGLFLTDNESLMIKVRGIWPLKFEMTNHGMTNYLLKFGKENLYREAIKELLEIGNENHWTLRLNYAQILLDLPWQPTVD